MIEKNLKVLIFPVAYSLMLFFWEYASIPFNFMFSNLARDTYALIRTSIYNDKIVEIFFEDYVYFLYYSWLFFTVLLMLCYYYIKDNPIKTGVSVSLFAHFVVLIGIVCVLGI